MLEDRSSVGGKIVGLCNCKHLLENLLNDTVDLPLETKFPALFAS